MGDLILLAILLVATIIGSRRGFVKSLVGVASTLFSFVAGAFLYKPVSLFISNTGLRETIDKYVINSLNNQHPEMSMSYAYTHDIVTNAVLNILSFIIISFIIRIIIFAITHTANLLTKLPIISQANSLLGAIVGFVGGVIICYIVIGIAKILEPTPTIAPFVNSINNAYLQVFFYNKDFLAESLKSVIK